MTERLRRWLEWVASIDETLRRPRSRFGSWCEGYLMLVSDPQDRAESFDEDAIGTADRILSDEAEIDYPPESAHGLPFADSDVTDESFAERDEQQVPEVWERSDKRDEASINDSQESNEPA